MDECLDSSLAFLLRGNVAIGLGQIHCADFESIVPFSSVSSGSVVHSGQRRTNVLSRVGVAGTFVAKTCKVGHHFCCRPVVDDVAFAQQYQTIEHEKNVGAVINKNAVDERRRYLERCLTWADVWWTLLCGP